MGSRLLLALLLGGMAFVAPVAAQGELTLESLDARLTAIETRLASRPIGTVEAEGFSLSGEGGDVVSEPFALPEGAVIITAEMTGPGYQMMNLMPAPGSAGLGSELIVNGPGPYQGTTAASVLKPGDFMLEVKSDGPWSATIGQ